MPSMIEAMPTTIIETLCSATATAERPHSHPNASVATIRSRSLRLFRVKWSRMVMSRSARESASMLSLFILVALPTAMEGAPICSAVMPSIFAACSIRFMSLLFAELSFGSPSEAIIQRAYLQSGVKMCPL